ncbi:phospholipase D family protein [Frigidibacter sp. RF13]|uniref:phospholipase D-like domain-containing protein n=1 Tax=Frigidibacter sp. RF13 TaxID=2997340 RepID=UPI00226FEBF3|nr:phospholipase D family protein [Frigidibacter sp. RF13]MCY1127984.1 phospholipase D family protein [Frigidibacter sp. RF13]
MWFLYLPHLVLLTLAGWTAAILRSVFRLPGLDGRRRSTALPPLTDGDLAAKIAAAAAAHPGLSGILALHSGAEAFAARILLARAATRSIDAQYYIWQNDVTGIRLLEELKAAAERGVRVRLLVDDNGTPALDPELAALNALASFEVRVFNPLNLRRSRLLSYLIDFLRLNRRMHNKSFTVDGIASIIGGRNIGDIYFARGAGSQYSDLDLLAVGSVVPDVSREFDAYWNSQSSYPHELLVTPPVEGLAGFAARMEEVRADPDNAEYSTAVAATPLVQAMLTGRLAFDWAETVLYADHPAKGLGDVPLSQLLAGRLTRLVRRAETSIDLMSAYFVPGLRGSRLLTKAAGRGVRVRTLTNSLEATDVIPVHASYTKYRHRLLRGGVQLYELKADPGSHDVALRLGLLGSKAASLHAKTFAIDGKEVFVGSFNFDPRSLLLNCEMGFLVKSPRLAAEMKERFEQSLANAAWRVTWQEGEGLKWAARGPDGRRRTRAREPGGTLLSRAALAVIGLLPLEWLM